MKADRESNRLPLRAGAMLLFAVAVVFLLLGWNSAANSDNETPREKLEGAGQSAQAATTGATGGSTAASGASASATKSAGAGDSPKLCVLNAGTETGLAKEVSDELESAGFAIGTDPGNLSTSSITENTVFYPEGEQDAAEKIAEAVPGGAAAEPRPAAFSHCDGEIAVIVVTK